MSKDHDLDQRLRFLGVDAHGRAALRSLRPFLDEELPAALDASHDQLRAFPETRARLREPGLADQMSAAQRRHWNGVAQGDYGEAYLASIEAVGRLNAKAGLETHWQVDAAALVAEQLVRAMVRRAWPKQGLFRDKKAPTADQVADGLAALVKAVLLDVDFLVTAQAERDAEAGAERERAIAEDQGAAIADSIGLGLERLAEGDLRFRLNAPLPSAYEPLRADFNETMDQLQDTVSVMGRGVHAIRSGAAEITGAAENLSRRTEQQAASLEQTASALNEITATVRRTAEGADQARAVVGQAKADAERGGAVVREAIAAMGEIESSSRKVSQIIGVIDEIAFQTNLLALNAGVEAARAGDAGRGFAVVAQEVRALAQRSAEAAREIKTLISASAAQVGSGVRLVGETGQSLDRIVAQVADINGTITEIAASAQAQAAGLREVNGAVSQMDQVTQQNAAMVEQSTAAGRVLAHEAEDLAELLRRFDTGAPEPRQRDAPRRAEPPPAQRALPSPRPALESKASAFAQRHAARARSGLAARPTPDWDDG